MLKQYDIDIFSHIVKNNDITTELINDFVVGLIGTYKSNNLNNVKRLICFVANLS